MGMYMMLYAVSQGDIETLERHPSSTEAFVEAADPFVDAEPATAAPSLFRRLKKLIPGMRDDAPPARAALPGQDLWPAGREGETPRALFDLDKDWHFAHFMLSGTSSDAPLPEGFLLAGNEVGGDLGYGPLRLLAPREVGVIAAWLAALNDAETVGKIDQTAMVKAEIYPPVDWEDEDAAELAEHAKRIVQELRQFTAERVQAGDGMAIALT